MPRGCSVGRVAEWDCPGPRPSACWASIRWVVIMVTASEEAVFPPQDPVYRWQQPMGGETYVWCSLERGFRDPSKTDLEGDNKPSRCQEVGNESSGCHWQLLWIMGSEKSEKEMNFFLPSGMEGWEWDSIECQLSDRFSALTWFLIWRTWIAEAGTHTHKKKPLYIFSALKRQSPLPQQQYVSVMCVWFSEHLGDTDTSYDLGKNFYKENLWEPC